MASAKTISVIARNDLILVHAVQLTAKTNDKGSNLSIYWYNCCCDHFRILRENPYEEVD